MERNRSKWKFQLPVLANSMDHSQHQQQPQFPSETPGCSGWLWQLRWHLVPSGGALHSSCCPGNGSRCIHTSFTLHAECGDVYVPSESHVCYTLRRGCSYAVAVYKTPGGVYTFLQPWATLYISANALYRIPHSPDICLALRSYHL